MTANDLDPEQAETVLRITQANESTDIPQDDADRVIEALAEAMAVQALRGFRFNGKQGPMDTLQGWVHWEKCGCAVAAYTVAHQPPIPVEDSSDMPSAALAAARHLDVDPGWMCKLYYTVGWPTREQLAEVGPQIGDAAEKLITWGELLNQHVVAETESERATALAGIRSSQPQGLKANDSTTAP
jgi:hypothetical protein